MFDALVPLLWVVITFPLVLLLQRWIHRHLRGVTLLLTNSPSLAVAVYAIVLLPGVFLHELSHWITAKLLGLRTGRFSILPQQQPDGSLRLGYVEYYKHSRVGPVRESLVGGAPLLFGTTAVLLIGFHVFGVSTLVPAVQSGDVDHLATVVAQVFAVEDFWVWLYLLFAISNAMMPSPADRRAWPAFFWIAGVAAVLLYLLGFSDVVLAGLAGPAAVVFGYLGMAFSMTIAVNLVFMALIAALESLVGRLRGAHVIYGEGGS